MLGFGALAAVIGPKALVERRAWLASRLAALGLPAQDAVSSARV